MKTFDEFNESDSYPRIKVNRVKEELFDAERALNKVDSDIRNFYQYDKNIVKSYTNTTKALQKLLDNLRKIDDDLKKSE